jgi:hypothetical protein
MPYIPHDFLDNTADRTLGDTLVRLITDWEQNELYREVTPPTVLEDITREDLQLVCWEAVGRG